MPELCANTSFPECKHPTHLHEREGKRLCLRWNCSCDQFVAPADTVSVTVGGKEVGKIGPPPDGCEYVMFRDRFGWHITEHLLPQPEELVAVMLTREVRSAIAKWDYSEGADTPRTHLVMACRDAEASVQVPRPPEFQPPKEPADANR